MGTIRIFDIRDFGYEDGMDDAGPTIQRAIDATPDFISTLEGLTRPYRNFVVYVPQPSASGVDRIRIKTKVSIPRK